MKNKFILTSIMMIILIIILSKYVCAEQVINILVEDDCPYSCLTDNVTVGKGFIQDILRYIFEKNGITPSFQIVPWLRALVMFNSQLSDVDCMIGMKVHPVHKEIALYPEEEIAQYTHRFYALKDSPLTSKWTYQGLESLKNLRVGGITGWSYCDKEITQYLAEGAAPYVQTLTGEGAGERNFKRLIAGRIDLWIANINNTEYLLAQKRRSGDYFEANKIIGLGDVPVTTEVNVYPIFYQNADGKKYSEVFTKGIRELRKSGELIRIMAKYGLTDWKQH